MEGGSERNLQGNLQCTIPIPLAPTQKLSMGCPRLDEIFDGGIPCGSITEIVGESGVGKTQLALQLLLNVQLPVYHGGLEGSSLYLHTEMPFPFRRLHQIAFQCGHKQETVFDKIFLQQLASIETLEDLLPRLEGMIPRSNIRLIIIDSVASLFRGVFGKNSKAFKDRMNLFFKISVKLREIAYKFQVAIVVTNQVTDVIQNSDVIRIGEWLTTSGRNVTAALGLSWANCVNTRLFMSFVEKYIVDHETQDVQVGRGRRIQVVFAPHLGSVSVEYSIHAHGVSGVR